MKILTTGLIFHVKNTPSITYKVDSIDRKTDTVKISYVADGAQRRSEYFLPMAEKLLKEGTWIEGKGSDRMMVLIGGDYSFNPRDKDFEKWYKENKGKWLEVDTTHLHENSYKLSCGVKVSDKIVYGIKNDLRVGKWFKTYNPKTKDYYMAEKRVVWQDWKEDRPCIDMFDHLPLENDYEIKDSSSRSIDFCTRTPKWFKKSGHHLSCYKSLGYYRLSGGRNTFNFVYKNGDFYDADHSFKRVTNFKGKVTQKALPELKAFFLENHPDHK